MCKKTGKITVTDTVESKPSWNNNHDKSIDKRNNESPRRIKAPRIYDKSNYEANGDMTESIIAQSQNPTIKDSTKKNAVDMLKSYKCKSKR